MSSATSNYRQMVNVYVKLNFTSIKIHATLAQRNFHPVLLVHMMAVNVLLVNTLNRNLTQINLPVFVMITNFLIKTKIANFVMRIKNAFNVKTSTLAQNAILKSITMQLQLLDNANAKQDTLNKTTHV